MYLGKETDKHHINYMLHMAGQLNTQEPLVIAVPGVAAFHWLT